MLTCVKILVFRRFFSDESLAQFANKSFFSQLLFYSQNQSSIALDIHSEAQRVSFQRYLWQIESDVFIQNVH
jgi:hypothetical protein